mgnify:CR=1 FL=1
MKRLLGTPALLAMTIPATALANAHKEAPIMAAASAPMTAQQSRMGDCNKKATAKTGDARQAFMKTCLSGDAPMTQQDRMKKCNADATGKTGDARKAFMKDCLSS